MEVPASLPGMKTSEHSVNSFGFAQDGVCGYEYVLKKQSQSRVSYIVWRMSYVEIRILPDSLCLVCLCVPLWL